MSKNRRKRPLSKSLTMAQPRPVQSPLLQKRGLSFGPWLLMIVVIIGAIMWKKHASAERRQQTTRSQSPSAESRRELFSAEQGARMARLPQTRARHIALLRPLAESDMLGYQLLRLLEDQTYYSVFATNGVTIRFAAPDEDVSEAILTEQVLEVTVSHPEELRANGIAPAAMQYMRNRRQLILPEESLFTELWFGLGLAHELSHAHDHLISRIEPTIGTAESYAAGERRAYEFEIRLLERALAQAGVEELIATTAHTLGADAQPLMITDPPPPVWQDLVGFPSPARSRTELGIRCGLAVVAVNFYLIEQRGGGDREKEEFITTLHEVLGAPTQ